MADSESEPSCSVQAEHLQPRPLWIAAPMVRYSKLPFRKLVRAHGVHVACTPMIIAQSFVDSEKCRHAEFSTDSDDQPLIVQFAANDGVVLGQAARLVAQHCQGVDLNCGCPQRWAMQENYGSALIYQPELVADMVRQTRAAIPDPAFTISVKIRLQDSLASTISLCQQAQAAGASFLTVHGRSPSQRNEPVDFGAIAEVKRSLRIPVIANGDVSTRQQALDAVERTGADGVMAGRGLLSNPALFDADATEHCSLATVHEWIELAVAHGLPYGLWHHQLQFMLESQLNKCQRRVFNRLNNAAAAIDFIETNYGKLP